MKIINKKDELLSILNKYKVYAVDYDGTIIDSMPMWERFASSYVLSKGKTLINEIDKKIKYLSNYDAAKIIHNDYNILNSPEEVLDDINKFVSYEYPNQKIKSYSIEFLNSLKNGRCLLSSATPSSLLKLSTDALNISDKFDDVYSSSDLKRSKESASLFEYIIEKENIDKSNLLVVEDSILAMKACFKNNIDTLIVYDSSNASDYDEIIRYATYYVDLSKLF